MSEYKGQVDSISSPIALYNVIIPKGNPNSQNYILHTVTSQRKAQKNNKLHRKVKVLRNANHSWGMSCTIMQKKDHDSKSATISTRWIRQSEVQALSPCLPGLCPSALHRQMGTSQPFPCIHLQTNHLPPPVKKDNVLSQHSGPLYISQRINKTTNRTIISCLASVRFLKDTVVGYSYSTTQQDAAL